MELWVKCEHGSLVRHSVPPEGTRPNEYVPVYRLVWCDGPRKATLKDVEEWRNRDTPTEG